MPPIIDLIIRIKNAYASRRDSLMVPYSKFKEAVLTELVKAHYIQSFTVEGEKAQKKFAIELRYQNTEAALQGVKIFSKPGMRNYVKSEEIKPVLGGMGRAFLSTPQGIMTGSQARAKKLGGELLFHIW